MGVGEATLSISPCAEEHPWRRPRLDSRLDPAAATRAVHDHHEIILQSQFPRRRLHTAHEQAVCMTVHKFHLPPTHTLLCKLPKTSKICYKLPRYCCRRCRCCRAAAAAAARCRYCRSRAARHSEQGQPTSGERANPAYLWKEGRKGLCGPGGMLAKSPGGSFPTNLSLSGMPLPRRVGMNRGCFPSERVVRRAGG